MADVGVKQGLDAARVSLLSRFVKRSFERLGHAVLLT